MSDDNHDFDTQLDAIESAYEFMLAYAAQGRDTDVGAGTSPTIREMLENLSAALGVVSDSLRSAGADDATASLAQSIDEDAKRAAVSVSAALSCPAISSQLVDNLNASIHLRALLTDLFLADEILKLRRGRPD